MFGNLIDVRGHKTLTGALWFYILSLTVLVGISTTAVHFLGMVGVIETTGTFFAGGEMHTLIGTVFTILLGGLILNSRNLTGDLYSVLLVAVGIYLAYTSSVMIGLVPLALLTTMKK
jgi:hypothetical protein